MSASRRLSRLKRGPLVNDVANVKVQINNNNNMNQQKDNGKMVNAFTVLTWHEQRINDIDKTVTELSEKSEDSKNEILIPLVETIEALEKKLELLNKGYDSLIKLVKHSKNKDETEDIKSQVNNELNTVKLNITEN
jgi:hypothetical protein